MLVVADSSPVNLLVRVGAVEALPRLFTEVAIPPQVRAELLHERTPDAVRAFIGTMPEWLVVIEPVGAVPPIPSLDPGEEAAIHLARELNADAILIDDKDGRREAVARRLSVIGTLGVLERAAEKSLIDLPAVIASLQRTDFRISRRLLADSLLRWQQRRER